VKIKAILDTNVFISGVFWKGPPFEILKAWQERRFRLAISLPILDEYRRVFDELTKQRAMPVLGSILRVVELYSEMVEPVSFSYPVCSDPDDDKFLEAAIAAGASYVVSGDRALLNVKSYHGVEIVSPSRFLKLTGGPR
jgi:putative PIN family toxin of toxin-antitoxin system